MSRISFSTQAATDIDGIWNYTAETWGLDKAHAYTDDIRNTCNALATGLKKGRAVKVRDGYLKYAVGKHVVFFVQKDDGIAVIRILHQQMDTNLHL